MTIVCHSLSTAGIPEAPKKAKFPSQFTEHESFTCITAELLQVIEKLPRQQQKELRDFIQTVLYPCVVKGKVPHMSSSPQKLMPHVMQYCNPLNMELLTMIIKYLSNNVLTKLLKQYERTLLIQLQHAGWDTGVDVAPPPAYKIVLVNMRQGNNCTVRDAVEVQEFLAENVMFKGHHGILCLAGVSDNSLVFYLAEGTFGPVLHRILHQNDKVHGRGIEQVTFDRLATLDVARGDITPHPDVSGHISKALSCYMLQLAQSDQQVIQFQ